MAENNLKRTDLLIALGGGVVGDLVGFCAATYLRGIKFVQIPTTLLSIIDSSVGGKTGVNLDSGKNLLGAFCQPALVVADIDTLKTLPKIEIESGLGELVKYGILAGEPLWDLIKQKRFFDIETLALCIEYKRDIVEADPHEAGVRKLLNLGHTFGHALEKLTKYTVPHGVAVAEGMLIIAKSCVMKNWLSEDDFVQILEVLQDNTLLLMHEFSAEQVINAALNDKKSTATGITIVAIEGVGKCTLRDIPYEELEEFLHV